jgi:hypothetical protein
MSGRQWQRNHVRKLRLAAYQADAERTTDETARRRAEPARTMSASWGGSCHVCGDTIEPGEQIWWRVENHQISHERCGWQRDTSTVRSASTSALCWVCGSVIDAGQPAVVDDETDAARHLGCSGTAQLGRGNHGME